MTISSGTSAPIATGVNQLQFTFHPDPQASYLAAGYPDMYREIDVNGIASVPEPGAIVLLATGLIGLLAYAWRKRR